MRDVVFRGVAIADAERVRKGELVYGSLVITPVTQSPICSNAKETHELTTIFYVPKGAFSDWNMPLRMCSVFVDPDTVQQSTIREDVRGRLIYEGDTVRGKTAEHLNVEGVVQYDASMSCFTIGEECPLYSVCEPEVVS